MGGDLKTKCTLTQEAILLLYLDSLFSIPLKTSLFQVSLTLAAGL